MPDPVPTVRVALGDDVARVVRRSTYDLSAQVPSGGDIDLLTVTDPAALAYDGPGHAVRFPAGRFISLDVDAGGVVGVTASPHLRALALRDAIVLAREVGALLEHRGWTSDSSQPAAYQEVEDGARSDRSGFYRADIGGWRAGGDECALRLRQVASVGAKPQDRRYLLSVEFENAQVLRDRAAIMRRRQRSALARRG